VISEVVLGAPESGSTKISELIFKFLSLSQLARSRYEAEIPLEECQPDGANRFASSAWTMAEV
jgi:hypothetical protein